MEISSSLTGAVRVGLQIATSYRGPHLEVYFEVLNTMGPEHSFYEPAFGSEGRREKMTTRFQSVYIQFQIANIGGERAENIKLSRSGDFSRDDHRDYGSRFDFVIPQIAPGQIIQLFLLDQHELDVRGEDGQVTGIQQGDLIITAGYDSPSGLVNFAKTLPSRILRKASQHTTRFTFNAKMIDGDLPPIRYS